MPTPREAGDARAAEVPLLSVVIACLDAGSTLGVQLAALAGQRCPVPWELLICDNGSTDDTLDVARSFAGRIPALRIVDASAVRGAGAARNRGVQEARGCWLAFCDADDEVTPDWLATMSAALAEHRFVAGRFEAHRLNGARVLRSRPMEQQAELQSSDFGPRLPHAGGGNLGIHREDFLAVGGFDPAVPWLEDTDLSWRAQLAGVPLVFRPEVVVHVRLRQTFREMYRQGRHYGMAHTVLQGRYGRADIAAGAAATAGAAPEPTTAPAPAPVAVRAALPERVTGAVTWFLDHVVGGRLAWRVGWVVGHRSPHAREIARTLADAPVIMDFSG